MRQFYGQWVIQNPFNFEFVTEFFNLYLVGELRQQFDTIVDTLKNEDAVVFMSRSHLKSL